MSEREAELLHEMQLAFIAGINEGVALMLAGPMIEDRVAIATRKYAKDRLAALAIEHKGVEIDG